MTLKTQTQAQLETILSKAEADHQADLILGIFEKFLTAQYKSGEDFQKFKIINSICAKMEEDFDFVV